MAARRSVGTVGVMFLAAACSSVGSGDAAGKEAEVNEANAAPGLGVSAAGEIVLAKKDLGHRKFTWVGTAILPGWNADECGKPPADFEPKPADAIVDTCTHKIMPLATRHVVFAREGARIVMHDRTGIDDQALSEFPLAAEDDETIRFDFNPSHVRLKFALPTHETPPPLPPVPIQQAKTSTRRDGEWISIRQEGIVSVGAPLPVLLRYGLRAHAPSATFEPSFQKGDEPKHFFEINHPDRAVAKFDFTGNQVIRFENIGVPANDRAAADEALRVAVDYWNRVFRWASGQAGRVFVEVAENASNALIHEPGHDIVQWMTMPQNNTSRGNFQTDAITGEILFANAYISVGFFQTGRDVGIAFAKHATGREATDDERDQFMKDYMVETVAHELGHTLGLQHHFEASNLSGGKPDDLESIGVSYFRDRKTPADLSASVMEYLPIPLAGILGRRMRTEVLPHDVQTVARTYFGRELDLAPIAGEEIATRMKTLAYCNDHDVSKPTCLQFDHPLCTHVGAYCFAEELRP